MTAPISPWDYHAERPSPDGKYVAVFDDATEVAMGGPTRGTLIVREKNGSRSVIEFAGAGASFVWSSDSKAIAVPRWTCGREQTLVLLRVPDGDLYEAKDRYAVLRLDALDDYKVRGVDSPIYRPKPIEVQLPRLHAT